ncbi:MAG: DUF327 family protein [Treponema sp.]|nr:DUF327 family protein [Treponema sp.]MCL2252219.1 DUF327 family protein [Treponema sp.]
MAKIDPSVFLNPSSYSGVKDDKKTKSTRRSEKVEFGSFFDDLLGKTADDLGPLKNLPASEDAVNTLMDSVRSTGDNLLNHPLPQEILAYKQAVRNFLNYVVQNSYDTERGYGIQNKFKPSFKGKRSTPEAEVTLPYVKIKVIDKKLEDLAAMLLAKQVKQMELVSRLEEIKGLLIDLLL